MLIIKGIKQYFHGAHFLIFQWQCWTSCRNQAKRFHRLQKQCHYVNILYHCFPTQNKSKKRRWTHKDIYNNWIPLVTYYDLTKYPFLSSYRLGLEEGTPKSASQSQDHAWCSGATILFSQTSYSKTIQDERNLGCCTHQPQYGGSTLPAHAVNAKRKGAHTTSVL